jgi:putative transcriptional regulator
MTDGEAETNALADVENLAMSVEQLASAKRMSRVKIIRRAPKLTQEEFSSRYQIPLGTLRD